MNECKPLLVGGGARSALWVQTLADVLGRGLHSFPFQLNLSSSVHRMTQLKSSLCPGIAQVEL